MAFILCIYIYRRVENYINKTKRSSDKLFFFFHYVWQRDTVLRSFLKLLHISSKPCGRIRTLAILTTRCTWSKRGLFTCVYLFISFIFFYLFLIGSDHRTWWELSNDWHYLFLPFSFILHLFIYSFISFYFFLICSDHRAWWELSNGWQ